MLEISFFLSSLYFFLRYLKETNFRHFVYAMILMSITTLIRYQAGLMFVVYLLILLLSRKLLLNKLKFWLAGIIGVVPLIIFFCINLYQTGNFFPALFMNPMGTTAFNFGVFNFIPMFLQNTFLIGFILGLVFVLLDIFIDRRKLWEQMTLILTLTLFLSFLIFYIRVAEDRWLFEVVAVLVMIAGYGIDSVAIKLEKFIGTRGGSFVSVLFIVAILMFGVYGQVVYSDGLIKNKKETYLPMKEAFEFIRDNTPKESVIAGYGIEPYVIYYAERKYIGLTTNATDAELIPYAQFAVVHAYNPLPPYLIEYYLNNSEYLKPIYVGYESGNPSVIVYWENWGEI